MTKHDQAHSWTLKFPVKQAPRCNRSHNEHSENDMPRRSLLVL
jgi:hypothetical protein